MKRILYLLLLSSFAFSSTAAIAQERSTPSAKFRKTDKPIPDQYIVVLKADLAGASVATSAAGLVRRHRGSLKNVYRHALKGFSARLSEQEALALSEDPLVQFVEEDGISYLSAIQSAPPWGL